MGGAANGAWCKLIQNPEFGSARRRRARAARVGAVDFVERVGFHLGRCKRERDDKKEKKGKYISVLFIEN